MTIAAGTGYHEHIEAVAGRFVGVVRRLCPHRSRHQDCRRQYRTPLHSTFHPTILQRPNPASIRTARTADLRAGFCPHRPVIGMRQVVAGGRIDDAVVMRGKWGIGRTTTGRGSIGRDDRFHTLRHGRERRQHGLHLHLHDLRELRMREDPELLLTHGFQHLFGDLLGRERGLEDLR